MDAHTFRSRFWSVLPPLPLHGLNSGLVESFDHYVLRLARISGTSLRRMREIGSSVVTREVAREAPDGVAKIIYIVEALTGLGNLRHGTFWVLKDVVSPFFLGRSRSRRRWCPDCYGQWDHRYSYEPLLWSVGVVSCCPVHGCALESKCTSCGANQPASTPLSRRHTCVRCRFPLTKKMLVPDTTQFSRWVDDQIMDLIEFCSVDGQAPLPEDAYSKYIEGVAAQISDVRRAPAPLRSAIRMTLSHAQARKPTIWTMLNACALQAVSVREMLVAPTSVSLGPLIGLWCDYLPLPLRSEEACCNAEVACLLMDRMLHSGKAGYLPSLDIVIQETSVSRALLREADEQLYGRYQKRYSDQADSLALARLARAFQYAQRVLRALSARDLRCSLTWPLVRQIAKRAAVPLDEAASAFFAAVIYVRTLKGI
jgi:hypothetical protein